jgi:hypothetical protein
VPAQPAFWLKVAVGFGLALLAVVFLPGDGSGETPPLSMLLTVGVTVAFLTAIALWLGLQLDLGFPTAVIVYTVAWNVLVVLAKFALGPHGFYEVNQNVDIDTVLPTLDSPVGAISGSLVVFGLYAVVYLLLYRAYRRGLVERVRERGRVRTPVVVGVLVLALLFAAVGGIGVLVLVPLALAKAGIDYLDFVFTSSVSLFVGVTLASALALAILAFNSAAERSRALGDATLVVSLFWVGLAFLALYQALWVVYVLILTSIWPLKTVTPK